MLQRSAPNWALGSQGWTNPHTAPHHTIEVGAEIETDCSAGGEGPHRQKHQASGRLFLRGVWSSSHLQALGCPVFSVRSETLDIRKVSLKRNCCPFIPLSFVSALGTMASTSTTEPSQVGPPEPNLHAGFPFTVMPSGHVFLLKTGERHDHTNGFIALSVEVKLMCRLWYLSVY